MTKRKTDSIIDLVLTHRHNKPRGVIMALKNTSIKMTEGPLFKKILVYTVPIIFSGILQLLFNAADLVIVGHFRGEIYLAAVGATSSLINLIVSLFMGISLGGGIAVAHAIGSGNNRDVEKAVHTTVPLALISSVVITAVAIPLCPIFLEWMDTPESVIELSTTYMRIYFAGTVFNMLYNFCSAILRATGDTQRPLLYLVIAGAANVLLNIIFVMVFGMDVDGVALATVISQAISAILVLINLMRRTDICRLDLKKLTLHGKTILTIAKIGIPSGLQSALFSISNTLIQSSVNSFGDIVMSGITAASSIEGFVYTSMNAFMHTTQNFVSQNYGAKKFGRILRVLFISLGSVTVVGALLGGGAYLLGRPLLSIYIKESAVSEIAIEAGLKRLARVGLLYFLCGIMETLAGAIRGLGSSVAPMIVSLLGACVLRIVWVKTIFAANPTVEVLYVSFPISWIITLSIHAILFTIVFITKKKKHEKHQTQEQTQI